MARDKESPPPLTPREELLLKVAKEIVVKFIEVGARLPDFLCRNLYHGHRHLARFS